MAKNTVGSDGLTNEERYIQRLADKKARQQAFLKAQQEQKATSVAGPAADSSGLTFGGGGSGGAVSSSWGMDTAASNPNNVTNSGMFSGNSAHFVTGEAARALGSTTNQNKANDNNVVTETKVTPEVSTGGSTTFERATNAQINDIYLRLFGRPVASTGLKYWGDWSEQYNAENLENAIFAGASQADKDRYLALQNGNANNNNNNNTNNNTNTVDVTGQENTEAIDRNAAFMKFIESLGLSSLVDLFNGNVNLSGGGLAGPNASASTYTPYNPYEQSIGQVDYNSMLLGQNPTGYDPYRGLYNVPDAMKSTADQLGLFSYINPPQATPAAPYDPMANITVPTIDYTQLAKTGD